MWCSLDILWLWLVVALGYMIQQSLVVTFLLDPQIVVSGFWLILEHRLKNKNKLFFLIGKYEESYLSLQYLLFIKTFINVRFDLKN